MISTELLTEVLEHDSYDKDCDSFKILEVLDNEILISYCYPYYDNWSSDGMCDVSFKKAEYCMNIYELAHKCKIWAHSKGYMLNTVILTADNKTWYCEDDYQKTRTTWKENSEPLVIFKACEWILNSINKETRQLNFINGVKDVKWL